MSEKQLILSERAASGSKNMYVLNIEIQGDAQNVTPFYHPIKIVTSQYRCCKRASECCSSWKM